MDKNHLIEPENFGLWIAATFIIALLSLVIGLACLYRIVEATAITQVQFLEMHQKLETPTHKDMAKP